MGMHTVKVKGKRALKKAALALACAACAAAFAAGGARAAEALPGNATGGVSLQDAAASGAVESTWSMSAPDSIALQKEGNDGEPGTYTGSAEVSVSGEIYDGRYLTVSGPGSVELSDSHGWSEPTAAVAVVEGAAGLTAADVRAGRTGTARFTAALAPGKWTGTCTFTAEVSGKAAFAVYSADDQSLTFYKRKAVPAAGDTFNGKAATEVYTGVEELAVTKDTEVPWYAHRAEVAGIEVVDDGIRPASTAYWFSGFSAAESAEGLGKLDTSTCSSMELMFASCKALSTVNLSSWDTSAATRMTSMFYRCTALKSVDISSWDTSRCTSMSGMFNSCSNLAAVKAGNIDTSKVTNFRVMFFGCTSLVSVAGLATWDTSKVTDMSGMFYGCSSLESLDLSSWDTSKVTNMSAMFQNCSSITSLALESFDTSKVTNMSSMFAAYGNAVEDMKLTSLDLSGWDTSKVTDMRNMFYRCANLAELDLSSFDTSAATRMTSMFNRCTKLTRIYVGDKWSTAAVTSSAGMFTGCTSIAGGCGTKFDADKVDATMAHIDSAAEPGYLTSDLSAFAVYSADDQSLTLYKRKISLLPSAGSTFEGKKATAVYKGGEDTGQEQPWAAAADNAVSFTVADDGIEPSSTAKWLKGFSKLTTCDVSKLGSSRLTDINRMFFGCTSLASVKGLGNLDTSKVTDIGAVFSQCYKLADLSGTASWNTSKVTDMTYMLYSCKALKSLDLSNWDTSKVTDMDHMMWNCSQLTTVRVTPGKWSTAAVKYADDMFTGCTSIVGGYGTKYDSAKTGKEMAVADDDGTPGYLTYNVVFAVTSTPDTNGRNTVMRIYKRPVVEIPSNGDTFDGTRTSGVYTLLPNKVYTSSPWINAGEGIKTVAVVDDGIKPASTACWFMFFSSLATADLSKLDTSECTNMTEMFTGCSTLSTIYVGDGWSTAAVTASSNMLLSCSALVGGNGTKCATMAKHDKTYARADTASTPGYLTYKTAPQTEAEKTSGTAFAVYSADDNSLDFYKRKHVPTAGNEFNGKVVTEVYEGFEANRYSASDSTPWATRRSAIVSLEICDKGISPVSMSFWFSGCTKLSTADLSRLDTSKVESCIYMFNACAALTTVYADSS